MRGRIIKRRGFIAERVARSRVFQFRNGADVSRVQLIDGGGCLPLPDFEMLEALERVAIEIGDVSVVVQHAAQNFEIADAAGKGVGNRLENEKRERLLVVDFALDGFALARRSLCKQAPCRARAATEMFRR